MLTKSL